MRCLVIGAGIIGTMTAYELSCDGHEVEVVDSADEVASQASFANGGVVGASQVEPWAAAGMPLKLLSWLGRDDAPLLVQLRELPSMKRWCLRFLQACNDRAFTASTLASMRLALASIARLNIVAAEHDIAFDRATGPVMKIFSDLNAKRSKG